MVKCCDYQWEWLFLHLWLWLRLGLWLRLWLWLWLRFRFWFRLSLWILIALIISFRLEVLFRYCLMIFNWLVFWKLLIWLLETSCFFLFSIALRPVFLWFFDNSDQEVWRINYMKISGIVHWFSINNFLNDLTSFNQAYSFLYRLIFLICLKNLHPFNLLNKSLIIYIFIKMRISFHLVLIQF